jgi:serine/threonine protein phosphatase PrpC
MFEPSISSTFEEIPEAVPLSGVSFGQATHQGRIRDENEDHLGAAPELGFFVVADGVGGAPGGKIAARLATAAMLYSLRGGSPNDEIPDTPSREPRPSPESHGPRLCAAALSAHQMICDFAVQNGYLGAATTMASLWVTGDHVHVANTGDSRVYRLRGDRLEQLTQDHTAVQEHIDKHGALEERWVRLLDHVVTQVLGGKSRRTPKVHLLSREIQHRETFLLCTDGLTKMVDESEIALILAAARSPQNAADALVELANDAGGFDNITCIVVHVEPAGGRTRSGSR